MNPARVQDVNVGRIHDPSIDRLAQDAAGLLPQDEARPRPDVSAALPPFQHEATRPFAEELAQQLRRGRMQIGGDSRSFVHRRLIGPTPGNQDERRSRGEDALGLFAP